MSKRRFAETCCDFLDASLAQLGGAKSSVARAPLAVSTEDASGRGALGELRPQLLPVASALWHTPPGAGGWQPQQPPQAVDALAGRLALFTLDARPAPPPPPPAWGAGSAAPAQPSHVRDLQHRLLRQRGGTAGRYASPPRPGGAAVRAAGAASSTTSAAARPPPPPGAVLRALLPAGHRGAPFASVAPPRFAPKTPSPLSAASVVAFAPMGGVGAPPTAAAVGAAAASAEAPTS